VVNNSSKLAKTHVVNKTRNTARGNNIVQVGPRKKVMKNQIKHVKNLI